MNLGRSGGCDVCISDDQASRRHVELSLVHDPVQPERSVVLIQDLGSRNGTLIDGTRVADAELTLPDSER